MVKYPYNINRATVELVGRLLKEPVREHIETIKAERGKLVTALSTLGFVKKVYPSDANFLLVKVDDADRVYDYLIDREIIVRNRNRVDLCTGCLRITIGTPDENKRLIKALEAYKDNEK